MFRDVYLLSVGVVWELYFAKLNCTQSPYVYRLREYGMELWEDMNEEEQNRLSIFASQIGMLPPKKETNK